MTGYIPGVPADIEAPGKRFCACWGEARSSSVGWILGAGGEQVTEMAQDANGAMNWQRSYVYAGSALIATYDPVPNPAYNPANPSAAPQTLVLPSFRLTDWLGTMRATTDAAGVWQGACTGLPFGDGQACSGSIPDPHHFTGKERDAESGNDYFGARYYASASGRWLSPDWNAKEEPVPYAKMDDPQSLNLYAYLSNNPLKTTDPDGHVDPKAGQLLAQLAKGAQAALSNAVAEVQKAATQKLLNDAANQPGTLQNMNKTAIENENKAFNQCVHEKMPGVVVTASANIFKDASGNVSKAVTESGENGTNPAPQVSSVGQQAISTQGAFGGELVDAMEECEGEHPLAALSKNYQGVKPGDVGGWGDKLKGVIEILKPD